MSIKDLILYFIVGGTVTSLIVGSEESGFRILSGFAALVPVFTVVSYLFLGQSKGGATVGEHSQFVLFGTLVSWVPYMVVVALLAPRFGAHKAIGSGLIVFFVLAAIYLGLVYHYKLFHEFV